MSIQGLTALTNIPFKCIKNLLIINFPQNSLHFKFDLWLRAFKISDEFSLTSVTPRVVRGNLVASNKRGEDFHLSPTPRRLATCSPAKKNIKENEWSTHESLSCFCENLFRSKTAMNEKKSFLRYSVALELTTQQVQLHVRGIHFKFRCVLFALLPKCWSVNISFDIVEHLLRIKWKCGWNRKQETQKVTIEWRKNYRLAELHWEFSIVLYFIYWVLKVYFVRN